jgi:hypothetical protein
MSAVKNILRIWNQSTSDEVRRGLAWYEGAHSSAVHVGDICGGTSAGAGVIAALSPRNKWLRNLEDAYNMADWAARGFVGDAPKCATYNSNRDKAERILRGEDPLDVLGGLKVRAFFRLVNDPDRPYDVCVDAHAFRIARGEAPGSTKIKPSDYEYASGAYMRAAQVIRDRDGYDVLASQVQAVTWVTYRRIHSARMGLSQAEVTA